MSDFLLHVAVVASSLFTPAWADPSDEPDVMED